MDHGRPPQVYAVSAVDTSDPYTITLDSPYGSSTKSNCDMFRQGSVGGGVSGYQYVVTFDSNVGDLPALTVDGSGLVDDSGGNGTSAKVLVCNVCGLETLGCVCVLFSVNPYFRPSIPSKSSVRADSSSRDASSCFRQTFCRRYRIYRLYRISCVLLRHIAPIYCCQHSKPLQLSTPGVPTRPCHRKPGDILRLAPQTDGGHQCGF